MGLHAQHPYEPDCVFCEIAAGELPARFLYADGTVVSFLDIAPATRGHALVVPRAHRRDLWDIHDDDLVAVSLVARKVAVARATSSLRRNVAPPRFGSSRGPGRLPLPPAPDPR